MLWFSLRAMPQWYTEGLMYYGHAGYTAARKKWTDPDMNKQRNLDGKHYLVTGANAGLGFAIAEELAKRNAHVHMLCRDAQRAQDARAKIVNAAQKAGIQNPQVEVHLADIGSMDSVRAFAQEFSKQHTELHGLINNAGALFNEEKRTTEGVEMSMAISLGGSFLLTGLMLPLLSNAKPKGRVVNVSSGGQYLVGLDAADLAGKKRTGGSYHGSAAYSYAKRAQVELTKKWAEKATPMGVIFHVMHPGWARTPGVTSSLEDFTKTHGKMMRDMYQGADTAVWLAIADEPATTNGLFWLDRQEIRTDLRFAGTACTDEDRDLLWQECERICGWHM